jgi:hypothetical protein
MCTLTWRAAADGYDLFFNRDERHTRAPETPPVLHKAGDGLSFLAPLDGDSEGTWLAVNARGLCVALLNDYSVAWRPPSPAQSRGRLVLRVAACGSVSEALLAAARSDLHVTAAFTLALCGVGESALARWDGENLHAEEKLPGFLTSSSREITRVVAKRTAAFAALGGAPSLAQLADFHAAHYPGDGIASVCMSRADACTRSRSHVNVADGRARLTYTPLAWPGPKVAPAGVTELELPLTR